LAGLPLLLRIQTGTLVEQLHLGRLFTPMVEVGVAHQGLQIPEAAVVAEGHLALVHHQQLELAV
jgi:hypothetical protein